MEAGPVEMGLQSLLFQSTRFDARRHAEGDGGGEGGSPPPAQASSGRAPVSHLARPPPVDEEGRPPQARVDPVGEGCEVSPAVPEGSGAGVSRTRGVEQAVNGD